MPVTVIFTPTAMTAAQYNEIIRRLENIGVGAPPGRLYHICFGDDGQLRVVDVWASIEEFDRFGATLIPIVQQVGVDPGQPAILPSYNIIEG